MISGLVRHLGELHPTVLSARRRLVNLYVNQEHLAPEDPAVEEARFQLGKNLAWVGRQGEAVPLLETVLRTRRGGLGEHAKETVEPAQYALYRGAGGALSFTEWQEAGKPEHG